jgi:hypothetical protein
MKTSYKGVKSGVSVQAFEAKGHMAGQHFNKAIRFAGAFSCAIIKYREFSRACSHSDNMSTIPRQVQVSRHVKGRGYCMLLQPRKVCRPNGGA